MASCADIPVIEVRVYRRSTETLSTAGDRRRTQSLPRGMDLRRSLGSDLAGAASAATGSGSSGDSRRGSTSLHSSSHYTDMAAYSRSTSRKASARSSMASIGARGILGFLKDYLLNFQYDDVDQHELITKDT
jgi:hypothetical protein